ncbi:MAG: FKBP-type peptidyl-prolyl cis-trans isomerase [Lentisphaerae bacterium]|nr:FKBP-type peptidyl-prolyl cis-trans isomerase [Lentisphaerota bacterium]
MAVELKNDSDRLAYAVAMNFATSIRQLPVKLDLGLLGNAVAELLNGGELQLSNAEYAAEMRKLQELLQEVERQKDADSEAVLAAEKKFFEANGKIQGVITTKSGLQYQVLKEGSGDKPGRRDTVKVHYEGKLTDGKVFDSSIARGEPIEFPVDQVIPGWTEALQLMKTGAKYRLFIPSRLGYGAHGAGSAIPPHATLIFEVELLGVTRG